MTRLLLIAAILFAACEKPPSPLTSERSDQFITILGIAQDAGFPQAGCEKENCQLVWDDKVEKRHVVSLGLSDLETGQNWLFEATPDFPEQLHHLKKASGYDDLSGIFLTHAHIGHYTGLMYVGHESMGASEVPVYAMPRMKSYLESNGPWSQLVSLDNIAISEMSDNNTIQLSPNLSVTPFLVPHRDEFSETVGYRIESPNKKVLFIPDINKWHVWERDIIEEIAKVDLALLDATFYDSDELPGRNMSDIPHPYVEESIELFKDLSDSEKAKVTFIHFNHTNPLILDSPERKEVEALGFNVAREGMEIDL
ncbi:MAG: pyrroloquinoline quinone biosynthesis protein PqqB [Balneola sp.]|nr:pyrroloquinoline quinone biosynthesis protein PqqB [Balneola sp.]MBE77865.1 pyrroloquinoline quinone biosynthesis protein PqqB [Balneola sp.]HBX67592.1 pyrroloquinoline quinone biosynthesis protein PqqB [Balneolaceae bacterium]|tara:strand:+ start:30639 stop:31571 length:933 start_codon:yes stop_codon:yes gene_type:complete